MSPWNQKEIVARDLNVAKIMAKCGITRVSADFYHYKSFRYTNLKDAIAQANRDSVRKGVS